jgi:hypothetical protein
MFEHKLHVNSFQRKPSCSMLADRKTGITKLIVAFSNFAYAPKNTCYCCQYVILVDEIEHKVGKRARRRRESVSMSPASED